MEGHTDGSWSIPTVHPCSQSGRTLWVARKAPHPHEPNHEGYGRSIHNTCRTLPLLQSDSLGRADRDIRHSLARLVVSSHSDDDWRLASLGISVEGIGARGAVEHAPAAYFSSLAKSHRHTQTDTRAHTAQTRSRILLRAPANFWMMRKAAVSPATRARTRMRGPSLQWIGACAIDLRSNKDAGKRDWETERVQTQKRLMHTACLMTSNRLPCDIPMP